MVLLMPEPTGVYMMRNAVPTVYNVDSDSVAVTETVRTEMFHVLEPVAPFSSVTTTFTLLSPDTSHALGSKVIFLFCTMLAVATCSPLT